MAIYGIQLMTGILLLVLGLSYLIRADDWFVFFSHLQKKGRRGSLLTGLFTLLTGGFIVSFHWVWQGMAIFVTLTGLLLLLKGTVYMLYPNWLPVKLATLERHNMKKIIRFTGIALIILASAILYEWSGANIKSQYSFSIDRPVKTKTITEIAGRIKEAAYHRQL